MANGVPNAEAALVDSAKLTEYLLSPTHPDGRHKAEFFTSFGFARGRFEAFRAALLEHGATRPLVETMASSHGEKFVLRCSIRTPDGRDPCIDSVWIIDAGLSNPRLITAYPARRPLQ